MDTIWIWSLFNLLSFEQNTPSHIYCDNISSNILTWDPLFHVWTKHIDIQHMYENASKPATYHMHISPPVTTSPTVLPSHPHAHSSKTLLHTWECPTTFQLEGGCWNTSGILVYKSERSMTFYLFYFYYFQPIWSYMGPCGHRPAPQLFDKLWLLPESTTEVSNCYSSSYILWLSMYQSVCLVQTSTSMSWKPLSGSADI